MSIHHLMFYSACHVMAPFTMRTLAFRQFEKFPPVFILVFFISTLFIPSFWNFCLMDIEFLNLAFIYPNL